MKVTLREFPAIRVAYRRRVGAYQPEALHQLWNDFVGWCAGQGLLNPAERPLLGICQDNPDTTPPDICRYDVGVVVDESFVARDGVDIQVLPGGQYACAVFTGTLDSFPAGWQWLCHDWMPASGYRFAARPAFEYCGEEFYRDEESGALTCWLCVAVEH